MGINPPGNGCQQFDYSFDNIGNRTQTLAGGDQTGQNQRSASYTANNLNQYSSRGVPGFVDVMGQAFATNSVTVNSSSAYQKGEYFREQVTEANSSAPVWAGLTVSQSGQNSVSGNLFVPQTPESFGYDLDGNLTSDGRWNYTWDAENRLIKLAAKTSVGPQNSLQFEYDSKSRRIRKQVWSNTTWTGSPTNDLKFLYDGWNLVAEVGTSGSVVQSYAWGLDLSGSGQGAGGVGGLIEVNDANNGVSFAAFDGNGNVGALVNAIGGTNSARYEYGPFGEVIRATGLMARTNPLRFSTKYQDDETDLLYYGYRYYNPNTGGWLNRDPIFEAGGKNLYCYVANDPIAHVDPFGLWRDPPGGGPEPQPPEGSPGYHDMPSWFDHPADEGKPCCCATPATLQRFARTDSPPTRTLLSFSIDIQLAGCYKDLGIVWWTCWRPNGSGGFMPGYDNQTSASLGVFGITIPGIGDLSTGPHITQTWIRYLSCENGKWTKHREHTGRTYVWQNGRWTW